MPKSVKRKKNSRSKKRNNDSEGNQQPPILPDKTKFLGIVDKTFGGRRYSVTFNHNGKLKTINAQWRERSLIPNDTHVLGHYAEYNKDNWYICYRYNDNEVQYLKDNKFMESESNDKEDLGFDIELI